MNDTLTRLMPLLGVRTNMSVAVITELTTLEELDFDSLGLADICIAAEDEFEVEIMDDDLSAIVTVGHLIALIDSKVAD